MTKEVDFFLFIMITMATYPVLARLSSTRPWKPEEKNTTKFKIHYSRHLRVTVEIFSSDYFT